MKTEKSNSTSRKATLILAKQLKELQKNPVEGFSGMNSKNIKKLLAGLVDESNLFEWDLLVYGPPETMFEGGLWKASLSFPSDFPDNPPVMKFKTEIWHPNIYKDGKVCISILHASGDDEYGYEKSSERWNPILSVEAILLSVISMLAHPNIESPANIDAATQFRDDPKGYKKKVKKIVEKSMDCL